jgi:hypothetical protein
MFQKLQKFNKILLPVAIIIILVLVGILVWRNLPVKDNTDKKIELSDRTEIFSVSGAEADNFLEVIFDPFEVEEGERQKIIVTLKNPGEIQSFKAILKDEDNIQEKEFKQVLLQKERNQASYQIIWQPQRLVSAKSYPVEFEYLTKSGEKNEMTLFWHTESF